MIKLLIFIILIINSNTVLGNNKKIKVKNYCTKYHCTKIIKKINIGKFYFKSRNCETKDYRKCQIWFGTPKNKFTANWVKHYRIINGPIPLYLPCYQGKPAWFNDIPFPIEFSKSFDFINILKKFNFQHKEKVYYNNPSNKTFNFFSTTDKSFGILVNKKKPKGSYINNIYIFNTQTEEMKLIETECS